MKDEHRWILGVMLLCLVPLLWGVMAVIHIWAAEGKLFWYEDADETMYYDGAGHWIAVTEFSDL